MNLDFILFAGPRNRYNFIQLWGETIFVPCLKQVKPNTPIYHQQQNQQRNDELKPTTKKSFSFFNGCKTSDDREHQSETMFYNDKTSSDLTANIQESSTQCQREIKNSNHSQYKASSYPNFPQVTQKSMKKEVDYYIPCLFLNSLVRSKYIIFYFHSSGEDIKIAHPFLSFLRNSYQANVIAIEYRGYSIYTQFSSSSKGIKADAKTVYQFIINKLGFKEQNIIIMGRSIGTGVALQLLKGTRLNSQKMVRPRALVLISPFASVKELVKDIVGRIGSLFTRQNFNNTENIIEIKCPVFVLHGKADKLIPWEQASELLKNCYTRKSLHLVTEMDHSSFDYYSDLVNPLRQFLMIEGVNFYEKNMKGPIISETYFELPDSFQY